MITYEEMQARLFHAENRNRELIAALIEAKSWHQGDRWRDGDTQQRAAWESHLIFLDSAISSAIGETL